MTYPSKESLINYDRMHRQVICVNPTHDTIIEFTNETQPKCPICDSPMVRILKSVLTGEIINTPREK